MTAETRPPERAAANLALRPIPEYLRAQVRSRMTWISGCHLRRPRAGRQPPRSGCSNLLEEARLADELGLDLFGVGEHHRPDYLVSLAGDRARGARGADEADPARERGDRALVGRPGSRLPAVRARRPDLGRAAPRSSPGAARSSSRSRSSATTSTTTTSSSRRSSSCCSRSATTSASRGRGRHRAPLEDARVWPRPVQEPLPVWVAVGGTPESVVRARARPADDARDHRRTDRALRAVRRPLPPGVGEAGHEGEPPLAINTHAFVADTARPPTARSRRRISGHEPHRPRARLAAVRAAEYEALAGAAAPLAIGSPEQVAEKIVRSTSCSGRSAISHT